MPKVPLSTRLKADGASPTKPRKLDPLWKGPHIDGVTQSLLSLFCFDRERFRIKVIEGLGEENAFYPKMEFGNMWHVAEEAHNAGEDWLKPVVDYARQLCSDYPTSQDDINKWYNVVKTTFPIYLDYWEENQPDMKVYSFLQEISFRIPYKLPSDRIIFLRGKWDTVDQIQMSGEKNWSLYVQDHKTKGNINELQLQRQLTFDLQTMTYVVALEALKELSKEPNRAYELGVFPHMDPELVAMLSKPLGGIRYNVIRRPLSGGRGTIRPYAEKNLKSGYTPPESDENFYGRLAAIINEEPEYYFMRWLVTIGKKDIDKFKNEFLNPCLEQLCDWWGVMSNPKSTDWDINRVHFRLPYGVYNPIVEGYSTPVDTYLENGSILGLRRAISLFKELE